MKRLKPEIITTSKIINGLAALSITNTIGTLDQQTDFALLKFDDKGIADIEPVKIGFPTNKSYDLYSDDENNIMWVVRGKGVYAIDLGTKATGHIIASNDGNGAIDRVFTVDPEKKILAIDYNNGAAASAYWLFDLANNKPIQEIGVFEGMIFNYYNNLIIGEYWDAGVYDWKLSDLQMENFRDDKLTKALNKFQVNTWHRTKTMHLKKRILLGTGWPGSSRKKLIYYSVRWDEKIEKIKVEPLLLQVPENCTLDDDFVLSQDGNWMKTLLNRDSGMMAGTPELVIYNVSDIYPQGLSLPIYCGYTHEGNNGAFLLHDTWGPCYVEQDSEFSGKLFVYRLNDGLKLLADSVMDRQE